MNKKYQLLALKLLYKLLINVVDCLINLFNTKSKPLFYLPNISLLFKLTKLMFIPLLLLLLLFSLYF